MIGVAVQPAERAFAAEFFELCKTSWEFHQADRHYDVLICTPGAVPAGLPRLVLYYSGSQPPFAAEDSTPFRSNGGGSILQHADSEIPVYGAVATFAADPASLLRESATSAPALHAGQIRQSTFVWIGYDLFGEIRHLLSEGQPPLHARTPTLERHIALLRDLVTRGGVPFVEIPPVPEGYSFIACLTHDIDHPVLRNHFCDPTMFGFIYRATICSALDVCRGRKSIARLATNLAAVARLPFVYLGLARDFWACFDYYLEIEAGRPATYFVMAQGHRSGRRRQGNAPAKRAARYTLSDIMPQLRRIAARGGEVALHGLDAWLDADSARAERNRLSDTIGRNDMGVRMHWLYFDGKSPAALDDAGFAYDSSFGYTDAIGFRAGTTQAYRPPGAGTLLELPLNLMDTAMFYPDYMNLREDDARTLVRQMIDEVARHGGALTVNWHDRSIAPERLWGEFYRGVLRDLESAGAWFATAADTAAWFRKRRAAKVKYHHRLAGGIDVEGRLDVADSLPDLKLRIHTPKIRQPAEFLASGAPATFTDVRFGGKVSQRDASATKAFETANLR